MSVEEQIQAAALQNSSLLKVLSETDYAPPALEQHKRYIADISNETKKLDAEIKRLEALRMKELKDHEKYRDSVMKRFAYKVGRKTEKFEAKASKEEREYFDVLQQEHKAKEIRTGFGLRLDEANIARTELENVAARHVSAQRDLDALYDSIFDGPSPGFPEEDEKERFAGGALQEYHTLRTAAEAEGQAAKVLGDAQNIMKGAIMSIQEALDYSRMDMFGGGSMVDMMERNALCNVEVLITQCQMQVMQAQRMSAAVQPLPPINIARGNIMSDVFFDNIFTDMAFHDKIKQSAIELQRAAASLDQQAGAAKQRHADLSQNLPQLARTLEDSRAALQKARELAFERVAGRTIGYRIVE